MGKHLKKDEELALGVIIQDYLKAEEELNTTKHAVKEKRALKRKVSEGHEAVDKLVRANIGLVHDRARRFKNSYPSGPEYDDLVQEGMVGLMTAVKKYDPTRGNKFSTVAFYWIVQAIARGANKTGRTVRLPENRINDFTKMNSIINSLDDKNLNNSEIDEIVMERLNLSRTDLINIRSAAYSPASLNRVVGHDSGARKELVDFVAEKNPLPSSEDSAVQSEMNGTLFEAINGLDSIKRDVILAAFSLSDDDVETVRQRHNLQPVKFKRLRADAMKDLKEAFNRSGLSFEDFSSSV